MENTTTSAHLGGRKVDSVWAAPVLRACRLISHLGIGERVQICTGPLADLEGVLVRFSADGRCVVRLLLSSPGVFVCIGADQLKYLWGMVKVQLD